jgi:predicted ArsR family transcriptional regulator
MQNELTLVLSKKQMAGLNKLAKILGITKEEAKRLLDNVIEQSL